FTGEEVDVAGLIFLRARYYSPDTGLFMSRDQSSVMAPGWRLHPFSYAEANPLRFTDPLGLEPNDEPAPYPAPPAGTFDDKTCLLNWEWCVGSSFFAEMLRIRRGISRDDVKAVCKDAFYNCLSMVWDKDEMSPYFDWDEVRRKVKQLGRSFLQVPGAGDGGLVGNGKESVRMWPCY
ncbi:MAG: RHS repeat-associated core domain-containing protein, partial [Fimbriimonadaceae bacterium]